MEYAFHQLAFKFGSPAGHFFPTFSKWALSVHDHFIPHPRNNYHPHILGHRVLGLFSLLLITVKVAAITLPLLTLSSVPMADASAITQDTIVRLTNGSRVEFGLPALTYNAKLARAAQAKADDMLSKQYFAHVSPEGKNPWSFFQGAGYSYISAGENLAVDFSEAESVDRAWMNSPGHRANILNKNFQEIGIGISRGTFEGHDTIFVVQHFGAPAAPEIKTLAEPTQVENAPAVAAAPPAISASAPSAISARQPAQPAPLALDSATVIPSDGGIKVTAAPGSQAVKVVAVSGMRAFMLDPRPDNVWEGFIPQAPGESVGPVTIMAFDMSGSHVESRLAELSGNLASSYGNYEAGEVNGASISFFGKDINPTNFQHKFYLVSIIALLVFLAISIAVRHRVQHVSLVANSSFVAMLACLLWMAG